MSTPDPYGTPGSASDDDPEFRQQRERDAGNREAGGRPQYGAAASGDRYGRDAGPDGHPQQGHARYGDQYDHGHGGYPQQGHAPYGDHHGYDGYRQGSAHDGGRQGHGGHPQHGAAPYGYPAEGPYGYQGRRYATGPQPGVPVGLAEAIRRFYAKYVQFSGRASRSEYWWATLYLFLANMVLEIMITAGTDSLGELNAFGTLFWGLSLVFALANFLPSLAITIRRLHDVGLSGWFVLLALVPIAGWIAVIVLLILPPKPEGARFDR